MVQERVEQNKWALLILLVLSQSATRKRENFGGTKGLSKEVVMSAQS
jgi:hypothetical protein